MATALSDFKMRREKERRWHHDLRRYVVLPRRDGLACVWDAAKGVRVSRWLRPENAERVCGEVNHEWRIGGKVTGWVCRMGDPDC